MNYYGPRQRDVDGRWDYTRTSGDFTFADGYCMGYSRIPDSATSPKYHTNGHASPEEACECFKEYELDHFLRFTDDNPKEPLHPCHAPECKEVTSGFAIVTSCMVNWWLCKEHRTREVVDFLHVVSERFSTF